MLNYIYDGSFQGVLTLIYDAVYLNENPGKTLIESKNEPELFSQNKIISSDTYKANRVIKTLSNKFNLEIIRNIYYSFLSNDKYIEKKIFDYVKLSLDTKSNIEGFYSNDKVLIINKIVHKVLAEKHRFIGIIRFKLLKDELYYSSIEPDNNITGLLITHSKNRFSNRINNFITFFFRFKLRMNKFIVY